MTTYTCVPCGAEVWVAAVDGKNHVLVEQTGRRALTLEVPVPTHAPRQNPCVESPRHQQLGAGGIERRDP